MNTTRSRLPVVIAALVAILGLIAITTPAQAIPGDGAGPDTPGTSASVSPRQLSAGALIRFTLGGFPAGEVVNIKIDDGDFCSQRGVHGACVVHQQRVGSNGSVSGSFVLPTDLKPGRHWLRFLASQEMRDASGAYLGVKGFTRRGGAEFTVLARVTGAQDSQESQDSPGSGSSGSQGSTGTTQSSGTGGTTGDPDTTEAASPSAVPAGQPVPVRLEGSGPAASPAPSSPTPSAAPSQATLEATVPAAAADASDRRIPWWGLGGLGLTLIAAASVIVTGRRSRG